ncbi:MAG: septum formation protein Maf [Armatimonadetes bacterium RBG_16_58_9]|nr:MAG: septum formation protein Maf [Armatimonadetes bacterium RBG_16_58_9]
MNTPAFRPDAGEIILASASPRRKELLSLVVADFRVVPSSFDECEVPDSLGPSEHVLYSARMKARDVAGRFPGSLVIGADTIVVVDDTILGKPVDAEDAAGMLRALGGRTHQVYTGLAVVGDGKEESAYERTNVTFGALTEELIARYVATGEPLDKAGAYAIQGRGSVLIESVSGCYFNVVGLPIYRLGILLEKFAHL